MASTIPIFGFVIPLLLWPIEQLLPYPYLIEEFAKAVVVYILPDRLTTKEKLKVIIFTGIAFSLSETVLYIPNLQAVGSISTLLLRLVLTTGLHVGTFLTIFFWSNLRKKLIFVGVILAILIHYLFNVLV